MKKFLRQYLFLILAGTLIALGIFTTAVSFIKHNPMSDREYIPLNTRKTVDLEPGKYAFFYEYDQSTKHYGPLKITRNHKVSNIQDWITVSVRNNGENLNLLSDESMTYTLNEKVGQSIISFEIINRDKYEISIETQDHEEINSVRITLIADFTKRILSLFKNFGIYILFSIPFTVVGFWIYRKEEKRKRIER